jgi:two-component system sensor histidine kinase KdpD
MAKRRDFRRSALVLLRGAALLAVVTAITYYLKVNSGSAALVFLIAVVALSLDSDFAEAAILSVMAVASLDYFFIRPPFSFAVAEKLDAITLGSLLTASLIVTRIQDSSRRQALESQRQKQNMQWLYEAAQSLLTLPPEIAPGTAMLDPFLRIFPMQAVCIFDAEAAETYIAGKTLSDLAAKTRDAYIAGRDLEDKEAQIVARCLRTRDVIAGAIGFERLPNSELTANALTTLASAVMERARASRAAADATAQARAEMLRSAILDALAHEIKTPLAVILASAGGMRATGELQPEQAELAELIETEAARLGDLTTSLLRLARLDKEDVRPQLQDTDAVELAERAVRRYSKVWPDRHIRIVRDGDVGEVRVDPELMVLAVSQLVENSCRYAPQEASIEIGVGTAGGDVAITVANNGPPIPASERERIFERFFRGADARRAGGGTGLGLFVARKIARAHGGNLVLAEAGPPRIAFQLTIRQGVQDGVHAG